MITNLFVERNITENPTTQNILKHFKHISPQLIDNFDASWGKRKKPYLHKRTNLSLYLAEKKGKKVKLAPDAYGLKGEPHYYHINSYNCIYECEYCYLQGYFNTPDLVIFVNLEEIIHEMSEVLKQHQSTNVWFHAGEFSDSLALSHLTNELTYYHQFLTENTNAIIELRTKSVNIKPLLKLAPLKNLIISFSLSPSEVAKRTDLKTPSTIARISAIKKLAKLGHPIGIHFDPVIYQDNFAEKYQSLLEQLKEIENSIAYLSLGVVRFTKDSYREVERNYPSSSLHSENFIKSFDNKLRYPRPLRRWMLNTIKDLALRHGFAKEKIYLCME